LISEDLKLSYAKDFREDAQSNVHLDDLVRQLSEAILPLGKLVAAHKLSALFLAHPERINALRNPQLVDPQKPMAVSGVGCVAWDWRHRQECTRQRLDIP
jgi:hypothetical protein